MSAKSLIMVKSSCFGSNPETLLNNVFQKGGSTNTKTSLVARKEFDSMVSTIRSKEIEILVFEKLVTSETMDAVFPNNWLSTQMTSKKSLK